MSQNSAAKRVPRKRIVVLSRGCTLLLLALLFLGTHVPPTLQPPIPFPWYLSDKLFHFAGYLVLTLSTLWSWKLSVGVLQLRHYVTVWMLGTLYSALDEVTQIPVGRTCDGADWLCDMLGIVLGLILFRVSQSRAVPVLSKTEK